MALLYALKYHDISTIVNVSGCHDLETDILEWQGKDIIGLIKNVGYFNVKSEAGMYAFTLDVHYLALRFHTYDLKFSWAT